MHLIICGAHQAANKQNRPCGTGTRRATLRLDADGEPGPVSEGCRQDEAGRRRRRGEAQRYWCLIGAAEEPQFVGTPRRDGSGTAGATDGPTPRFCFRGLLEQTRNI